MEDQKLNRYKFNPSLLEINGRVWISRFAESSSQITLSNIDESFIDSLKKRGVDIAMDITEVDQSIIAFIRDNTGNLIEIFQQPEHF